LYELLIIELYLGLYCPGSGAALTGYLKR
jgi:hypothetical protein